MKKGLKIVIAAVLVLAFAGGAAAFGLRGKRIDKGVIMKATNGDVLLITAEGTPVILNFVSDGAKTKAELLQTGDRLLLLRDDAIEETFPARTGVYYVRILSRGNALPENTPFGMLGEYGWLTPTGESRPDAPTIP